MARVDEGCYKAMACSSQQEAVRTRKSSDQFWGKRVTMKEPGVVEMAWHGHKEDNAKCGIMDEAGTTSTMRKGVACGVHVVV